MMIMSSSLQQEIVENTVIPLTILIGTFKCDVYIHIYIYILDCSINITQTPVFTLNKCISSPFSTVCTFTFEVKDA